MGTTVGRTYNLHQPSKKTKVPGVGGREKDQFVVIMHPIAQLEPKWDALILSQAGSNNLQCTVGPS